MKEKLRVIVFGVGFGQFYLRALEKVKSKYELVGIYSRGSEWSKKWAEKYDVPLYTDINKITSDIVDVACVVIKSTVVGGEGSTIAQILLKRGINVIQEHPVHVDDYINCIKIAKKYNCTYRLNTFYPELLNVRQFVDFSKKLSQKSDIKYINAECSVHVLFPLVDILGRALGGLRPWKFEMVNAKSKNSPFCIVYGYIHNIPVCINIQNQIEPTNPENSLLLLHKISLYTECGSLVMVGTNSDVIWEPCMRKYIAKDGGFHLEVNDNCLNLPVYEEMHNNEGKSFRDMFINTWPDSIKSLLEKFYNDIFAGSDSNSDTQFLIAACLAWQELGQCIGHPDIIHMYYDMPIQISDFSK
ncbi:Gfo/Idh/MocA family oxidoreductase [Clostridium tyrobutyricum]|uniref:Gfo/Idh/MocA family oxidoreductase n=1 Tax=Clostridium tyrobutyricum TaxID=1519 RepID=UPI001C3941B2|nr:Gfo/Idh/MocA family oxidoreductase [Clostridium tyrobutyricum]MBV4429412.1 Gfo/Idh/MocA family oxidoreductase [Clostridium tyrobutyricum]MBV4444634.1 Gfo/Idh/MocA family oxidoreductase [Clostridium tyrobutyricum]